MPRNNDRFIQQARDNYQGEPKRIARCRDQYNEEHVIIEMVLANGDVHYLDWIGAEYAESPDEFGDELPFPNLKWSHIVRGHCVPHTTEA